MINFFERSLNVPPWRNSATSLLLHLYNFKSIENAGYQFQLSGSGWITGVLTPVTHPPSRRNVTHCHKMLQKNSNHVANGMPREGKYICILILTVMTVWIFWTNWTEPRIKSFLSSKVATQSNRHKLSLFNRKSPYDRELSYKFAFMRYFYPNLYAKIIKIQIGNPACID